MFSKILPDRVGSLERSSHGPLVALVARCVQNRETFPLSLERGHPRLTKLPSHLLRAFHRPVCIFVWTCLHSPELETSVNHGTQGSSSDQVFPVALLLAMQLPHCLPSGQVDVHKEDYEENRNAFIGMLYILLGFVFISFNLIMLTAITRHPLINHACFKLLTIVSFFDLLNLLISLPFSGTLSLLKLNHCNSGRWITTAGYICMISWTAYCAASQVLALNRLLEFWNKPLCNTLFRRSRAWVWLAVPTVYCVALNGFGQAPFYFYDPYGGGWVFNAYDRGAPNYVMLINNYFKFVYLIVVYISMLYLMYRKISRGDKISSLQKSVALQCLAVSMVSGFATLVYPCIQYLPKSSTKYAPLIGQLLWVASNAATSIVYLTANRSVRRNVGRMLGMAEDTAGEHTNSVGAALNESIHR
ncbi:hypothetical protein QR680_004722 [Steinernema hermaphroditum]|uniref:Uncharacterized protein n=1 Tax=Steinernema hermaphroditum TaxID=289476 RepID=A0AA39HPL4_9BILA|nr:hypothetical protein QR680_004722 [Steinernema hermaphroditum]